MNANHWWISSGLAEQAARELVWFVIFIFIGIGVMMWRDMRKEERDAQKQASKGKTHKAD